MSDRTGIGWTDATINCITGCERVSPGCADCYACRLSATRLSHLARYAGIAYIDGKSKIPKWTGNIRWVPDALEQMVRWRRGRKIFINSMSDTFQPKALDEWIWEIFWAMEKAEHHIIQILTKWPKRQADFIRTYFRRIGCPEHIWVGVSIEDQKRFDERIGYLERTNAAVRFLSLEPLLGPVDVWPCLDWISWLIIGGEKGPNARPMHQGWVEDIVKKAQTRNVPVYFKQWGSWVPVIEAVKYHNRAIHDSSVIKLVKDSEYRRPIQQTLWQGGNSQGRRGSKWIENTLNGEKFEEFPEQIKLIGGTDGINKNTSKRRND